MKAQDYVYDKYHRSLRWGRAADFSSGLRGTRDCQCCFAEMGNDVKVSINRSKRAITRPLSNS